MTLEEILERLAEARRGGDVIAPVTLNGPDVDGLLQLAFDVRLLVEEYDRAAKPDADQDWTPLLIDLVLRSDLSRFQGPSVDAMHWTPEESP